MGILTPDQVNIHFFRPRSSEYSQVYSPMIDQSGNIDSWSDGFFDQFDKDMNYFAGWGE
jgi:predicted ATPase